MLEIISKLKITGFILMIILICPFLLHSKVRAIATNPLDKLPGDNQTPDDLGWRYIGSGIGSDCFDLADYFIEKVRYIMYLNNSNITGWDSRGADPDGVLVKHAANSDYDDNIGANAVTYVKVGDPNHRNEDRIYWCDNPINLAKVIGLPDPNCSHTKDCACALGHDPNPGPTDYSGEDYLYTGDSGYIVLDVACGQVDGLYCIGYNSEDSDRVIVDRDGDDFCISEVGEGESYFLFMLDYDLEPPWFMTGWGDTFSRGGYSGMEMQKVTSYQVPKGPNDEAYFSTYIISSSNTAIIPGYPSRRDYILKSYDDKNTERFPSVTNPDNSIYSYLWNIKEENTDSCLSDIVEEGLPTGGCIGNHIYFIEGNSSITLGTNWNQDPCPSRACIIVSKGSIIVPPAVDKLDAFFVLDGQFATSVDTDALLINGGVVSNTIDFQRNNLSHSKHDPAEIINYDPKYLDLFRDCLGVGYPFRIREYGVSY